MCLVDATLQPPLYWRGARFRLVLEYFPVGTISPPLALHFGLLHWNQWRTQCARGSAIAHSTSVLCGLRLRCYAAHASIIVRKESIAPKREVDSAAPFLTSCGPISLKISVRRDAGQKAAHLYKATMWDKYGSRPVWQSAIIILLDITLSCV